MTLAHSLRSIAVRCVPRVSPFRVAVSATNSKASFTTGLARASCTVSIADETSLCGNARIGRTAARGMSGLNANAPARCMTGVDALALPSRGKRHLAGDRSEDPDRLGDRHPVDARDGAGLQSMHPVLRMPG